jgi:hypothetical protein
MPAVAMCLKSGEVEVGYATFILSVYTCPTCASGTFPNAEGNA